MSQVVQTIFRNLERFIMPKAKLLESREVQIIFSKVGDFALSFSRREDHT